MHTDTADEGLPGDVPPRLLIQAIQRNLGITKKEIAARAGVSYGTVQRYSRAGAAPRRPRSVTLERLRQLYRQSLRRQSWWTDRRPPPSGSGRSEVLRTVARLLGHLRLPARPVLHFLEHTLRLAHEDAAHLQAAGLRERDRLLASRAAVQDLYVSLVHGICAEEKIRPPGGDDRGSGPAGPGPRSPLPGGGR